VEVQEMLGQNRCEGNDGGMMEIREEDLKQLLFEVYSAGFEAGMARNIDIATAYNNWWDARKKEVNQYDKG
jgi:hypothetical protein